MSDWIRVTSSRSCSICGKSDWCSYSSDGNFAICRRVDSGDGKPKLDKGGSEYWVYKLRDSVDLSPKRFTQKPAKPSLPSATLNSFYEDLLKSMVLSPEDAQNLMVRGLSEIEIRNRQYRTLGRRGRYGIVKTLISLYGEDVCERVPGIFFKQAVDGGYYTLAGPEGLLIPVRNVRHEIIALKIRRRSNDHPRYIYLSSAERAGAGPGSPVHVPLAKGKSAKIVRLTEGELKADIATSLGDIQTVSIPGVSTWRNAIPILREMGCETCRLAFDMDAFSNYHVANALKQTALQLIVEGFKLEIEIWDQQFKGIDDCLVAGGDIRIVAGGQGYNEIVGIFKKAKRIKKLHERRLR